MPTTSPRAAILLLAGTLALAGGTAFASKPRAAIVAAATTTANPQNEPRFTDPRDKIMATGLFESVAIIDVTSYANYTPTLEVLQQYDAVLTWSNMSYTDAVALGNVLADYVDAGGGVVVALFANTSTNAARFLQGRWQQGDYIAIPQNGGFAQGPGHIGQVLVADHPIFDGVESFITSYGIDSFGNPFGGYRPNITSVTPGSTKVATWNSGHTLVAVAPNPRVVELGFHPVSSDVHVAYWLASSDGGRLMANALLFSAGLHAPQPCPGDLTGDGVVDVFDLLGLLGAWGPCPPEDCDADLNDDGTVDVFDLLALLGAWGPCD
jgi:hypothetical protein